MRSLLHPSEIAFDHVLRAYDRARLARRRDLSFDQANHEIGHADEIRYLVADDEKRRAVALHGFPDAADEHGLDRGMPNQAKAGLMTGTMNERKNSWRHLRCRGRGLDRVRNHLRSAGVGRMGRAKKKTRAVRWFTTPSRKASALPTWSASAVGS